MNFKKGLLALLVISVFFLSGCEVYKTLYGSSPAKLSASESTQVERVEGAAAKDPATLAKTVYSSSEAQKNDPFKVGENPLGPFPKGKSLGFTLQQWLSASGIGIYSVDGDNSTLELSFKNLVPSGVYTVWCSRLTLPPEPKIEDKPCGADDGSQNSFTADAKGAGSFSLDMKTLEATRNETATLIAVAYHSDGKTNGASPGDFGVNSHVQIFFMMPEQVSNATKFEVPIKFTNHIDAGMPEQDVFIEKEQPPEPAQAPVTTAMQPTQQENNTVPPVATAEATSTPNAVPQVIPQQQSASGQETPKENPVVITVQETDPVNLVPKISNPDKDVNITFTYTSPLDSSGRWNTNYGDAGQYTITVTASNGKLTTSRDVLLIVNKKEEAPTIDSSKPIETALSIDESESIDFLVTASDLNKDNLAYGWKLDGVDEGNDTSYTYHTDFGNAGTHTVKFDVSDGVLSASKIWSVKVRHVNRPPVLEKINDVNAKETDKLVVTAFATDPDNDPLNYSISDNRFKQDGSVFTWQTDYGDHGSSQVTVKVSDGQATAFQTFAVNVEKVYRPPVILDIVQQK